MFYSSPQTPMWKDPSSCFFCWSQRFHSIIWSLEWRWPILFTNHSSNVTNLLHSFIRIGFVLIIDLLSADIARSHHIYPGWWLVMAMGPHDIFDAFFAIAINNRFFRLAKLSIKIHRTRRVSFSKNNNKCVSAVSSKAITTTTGSTSPATRTWNENTKYDKWICGRMEVWVTINKTASRNESPNASHRAQVVFGKHTV